MVLQVDYVKLTKMLIVLVVTYSVFLPIVSNYIPLILLATMIVFSIALSVRKGIGRILLREIRKSALSMVPGVLGGIVGIITYCYGIRTIHGVIYELKEWYVTGEPNLTLFYLLISMTSLYYLLLVNTHIVKIRRYVRENPGGPLIIMFMMFLIAAAIELAKGLETIANRCAEIAYYYLVAGVLAQLITTIREERRSKKTTP